MFGTAIVACSGAEFSTDESGAGGTTSGGGATAGSPGDAGSNTGGAGISSGGEPAAGEPSGGGDSSAGDSAAGDAGSAAGGQTSAGSSSAGQSSGGGSEAGSSSGGGNVGGGGGETCTLTCPRKMGSNGVELCECESSGECVDDGDCALATNVGQCCSSCQDAYPIETIDSEPCIVRAGEQVPDSCQPPICTDVLCPAIACAQALRAVCDAGQCVPAYDCPDGQIDSGGRCVPPCQDDSDCVMAEQVGSCCGACPTPMHRQTVEQEACLVEYGAEVPDECKPDPQQCALVACPAIFCTEPGQAVCMDSGLCGSTGPTF